METAELINEARRGDRKALSTLIFENRGYIAALVSRFIEDREQKKDVIQNICMKVVKSISSFEGNCRFTTWLYRIIVSEVTDFRRRQMVSKRVDLCNLPEDCWCDYNAPDELDDLARRELRQAVGTMLQEIPRDQKAAFSLFYLAGCRGSEAAEVMNISEANFFMKLKAARDALRTKLKKQGLGL